MKKFLPMFLITISCYCLSCNNSGGLSATAQKNLDAMHGVQKCFDTRDFSKLGDYIAEDGIDHAGESGDIKGVANMKIEFQKWAEGVDNPKTEIIKEMADDEYVMTWSRYTGTIKVAQMGYKPGENFDMKAIEVAKFKDGKATEHWSFMEPADMMKIMSKMKEQAPATLPADTTKKDPAKKM